MNNRDASAPGPEDGRDPIGSQSASVHENLSQLQQDSTQPGNVQPD